MTIYNFEEHVKELEAKKSTASERATRSSPSSSSYIRDQIRQFSEKKPRGRFFSAVATRFFFFLLLIADLFWGIWSLALFSIKVVINCSTLFMVRSLRSSLRFSWLCVTRSLVCMVALLVALFSPALGIMFACLYFLMYDKSGVEEIVPPSLRDQFRDFFPH